MLTDTKNTESQNTEKIIMNPAHPDWCYFTDLMRASQSYNRISLINENMDQNLTCNKDYTFTRRVLASYPDVDVEGTLEFFKVFGWFCDCEIMTHLRFTHNLEEKELREKLKPFEKLKDDDPGIYQMMVGRIDYIFPHSFHEIYRNNLCL